MHYTNQPPPTGPPSPPPPSRQSKAILQREYREKEVECFNTLRRVIKDITGEELLTRRDILRKAAELLLFFSEAGKRSEDQANVSTLAACEAPQDKGKVVLQREYREKEGELFNILYDVIKDITGEELWTRQEVLMKAAELLLSFSKAGKQPEDVSQTSTSTLVAREGSQDKGKVILQREYREKEGESFNILRDIIKDITGEELRTRQEILVKAAELLLSFSKVRKQPEGVSQADTLTTYEAPNFTPWPEGTTLAQSDYPSEGPSHWHSDVAPGVETLYYDAHAIHDQQSHFLSSMDSASGHGEGSSSYLGFSGAFNRPM